MSNLEDLNDFNDDMSYHPCSKKIMPSLFAWFLLIATSSAYFTMVLPMYIEIIGTEQFYLFLVVIAVHSFLFIYVVLNFTIATFMDPGRFPKQDVLSSFNDEQQIKLQTNGNYKNVLINDINVRMKWCTTCQFYRPPRSSHCGVCNACIDTMDHHCPWVSNCIARRNYKYFLQFLISLTIHMIIILAACIMLVLLNKEDLSQLPIMVAIFLIILCGLLIIPVGGLTGFHLVLVSRGRTTNEQVTGKFRTGVNPFDLGCCTNWSRILFSSLSPSYIKFQNRQSKKRQYLETKVLLDIRKKSYLKQQQQQPLKKQKYLSQPLVKSLEPVVLANKRYKTPQRHQSEEPPPPLMSGFDQIQSVNKTKSLNLKRHAAQDHQNIWEDRNLALNHKVYTVRENRDNRDRDFHKKELLLPISSSSSSYSSSVATNNSRYIRNDSYLNSNPVVIPLIQHQHHHNHNHTSNHNRKSNHRNVNANNKKVNSNLNNKNNVLMPIEDYSSYEITV